MNDDTISRQAAIDGLNAGADLLRRVLDENLVGPEREKFEWGLGLIESCISDMKDLQPAQPDRKKGKWVNRWSGDGSVWLEEICSECGLTFEDEPHGYNYCPNCGAEMEGDEDDR